MSMPKISIAMATYNGAKYLREQLDSLAAQTQPPYELVICDDGSTDTTLEIARQFAAEATFPVRVYRNETNLGYADNFLKAASLCEGDWVAFCDQDDVWLPHKLNKISHCFSNDVLLVIHSAELVDAQLKASGKRWPNLTKSRIAEPLQSRPWWTPAGFTQCVSAELLRNYPWQIRPRDFNYPERMQAHDKWTYLLANSLGRIAYIKESLALYRRHNGTVTGDYRTSFLGWAKGVRAADAHHYAVLSDIAAEYANLLSEILPQDESNSQKSILAIAYYKKLSNNLKLRAQLHFEESVKIRLSTFMQLCQMDAYRCINGKGLGWKAFIKDIAALV